MSILTLPSTAEDVIFDHFSAATLLRYARTCKTSLCQVQSYWRRKLYELLRPYFSLLQIEHLRQLQEETGMLISGSIVLQFLDRVVYPESDLDLYVENAHEFCEKIGGWLLEVGYVYVPNPKSSNATFMEDLTRIQEVYHDSEIAPPAFIEPGPDDPAYHAQFVFTFSQKLENGGRKVQVITSEGPPLGSILNFHSTCVMNILTHDTAYSIFPRATFEDRISLALLRRKPGRTESALRKYQHRGWTILRSISDTELDDPTFLFAPKLRYVGDALCWKVSIAPTLLPEQPRRYNIESNSWTMSYSNRGSRLAPMMMYEVVTSPRLQFSYLIESNEILAERLEIEIDSDSDEHEAEGLRPFLDDQLSSVIEHYRKHAP